MKRKRSWWRRLKNAFRGDIGLTGETGRPGDKGDPGELHLTASECLSGLNVAIWAADASEWSRPLWSGVLK
jgi:hypothetical protein